MNRTKVTRAQQGWNRTACILCSINCGLKVKTDGQRHFSQILGDKQQRVSKGYVCEKAQRLPE
ncbi:MAG: hypothetical protein GY732_08465 [Gammaproteobacteria bacterium]|nr:hypothetical protein [Gammaproteobacteria bacterium]